MAHVPDPLADPPLEVALDFVNTLEHSRDHDTEHLATTQSLGAWLADHGLLDTTIEVGERSLADARGLRQALRGVIDAHVHGRLPVTADLEVVNRWLRRRASLRLERRGEDVALSIDAGDDPVRAALVRIAEAAARGVVADDGDRLRVCANDECRWVYHDTSRGGRRKWCDMASCGNRAKARRHRERAAAAR